MNLSPREKDKLLISMAAMVARRRLERDNAEIGNSLGDQTDNLIAQALFEIDADMRMRGEERAERFREKFGQRISVR